MCVDAYGSPAYVDVNRPTTQNVQKHSHLADSRTNMLFNIFK